MLGKEEWCEDGEILNHNINKMTQFLYHLEMKEKSYIEHNFINNGLRNFKLITYHCQLTDYMPIEHFLS